MSEQDTTSSSTERAEAMVEAETRKPVAAVVVRSWPKIVMMWPTLLMAIICGILMGVYAAPQPGDAFGFLHLIGLTFLIVLAINMLTLLFDLNIWGFVLTVLALVVIVLALFLIDRQHDVWGRIGKAMSIRVYANSAFYFVFSLVLVMNLVIAWISTRFYYWKIEHNEIIIHQGFMHEQERHPTAQARFTLVVDDIVEYGLLGAGKLVFTFGDDKTQRELPTVPFVHKKARQLDVLLGRVAVVAENP